EIAGLKKRVQKLERKTKSRTTGLKRLRKVGESRRVESSKDKDSLGAQEDASKQGRSFEDIDKDAKVSLVDETQGREVSTGVEDSVAPIILVTTAGEGVTATKINEITTTSAPTTAIDEITLAQTLIEIKASKPKDVTTAATTTTTTRTKARGIVVKEPSEFRTTTSSPQASQPSKTKDKGKEIMIKPKENTQAMMEADRLLVERLQTREQEELTDEENPKLFMEFIEKKRKHFVALGAQEKRNKPPIKTQKRNQMSIYLKHMEAQEISTKKDENSSKKAEITQDSSAKRAGDKLESYKSKKQKTDENKEVEVDNEAELKKHMVTVKDDDIAIDATPLATKPPVIGIDREELQTLWKLVKTKHGDTRPGDEHERVLWGDLKVMFEPDIKSDVWRNLQGYKVTVWKLFDSCGVHFVSTAGIDQGLGSTSGIRAFALRNFDLEVMEFESAHSNTTAKLPILKLGEYEMWVIRIKQYFQVQDYALWEVIENGNSWVSVPQTAQENGTSVTKMSVPVTAEEKTNKKNDVKARSLLLMALPNEHQLTFSQYNDAKTMFAAIETRFGGNEATKKTQKTLLKQQYENFSASSTESLDSIFNRLQKIVSRLAILGVVITQEDLNSKFLTSLPPEWNTHVVVWMNKAEIETMSINDLYNNFKIVEQSVKKSVGASSGAQNLAFMTAPSTSSTNDVNTAKPAYEVSTVSPNVNTASPQVSTASFSDNVVYAFMVENPIGSNLLQQDLEQIHEDDLKAMDLKWQLSLLSMRANRYFQRTGKKFFINANDTAGYDKSKLKGRSYDEIQKLFDKEMKRVNSFVAMNSEAQEISGKKDESSSKKAEITQDSSAKRVGDKLESDKSKKQKTNENEEVEVDNKAELKKHMVTIKDDDIAIDAIPLATKPLVIVKYKLIREGIMGHYQLIRDDGFKRYSSMIRMLQGIDREDMETLWKLVKTKHGDTKLEDEHERVLWDVGADKRLGSESISSGEVPLLAAATDFATRGLGVKDVHHVRAIAVNVRASYPEMRKLFEDAAKLFSSIGKKGLADERQRIIEHVPFIFFAHMLYISFHLQVAGYVVTKMLTEGPTRLSIIAPGDDKHIKPALRRSSSTSDLQTSRLRPETGFSINFIRGSPVLAAATDFATRGLGVKDVRNNQSLLDLSLSDKMDAGTTSTTLTAKLPILNPGEYDLWLMRIEQYFLMTDYSLWERNKVEFETISLDDLYNNLKIYELELKHSTNISQNSQNVAFVSSNSTNSNNSTNEADNTAYGVSTAHTQSSPTSGDNLSDAVICAFLASQPNSPQMSIEDLEQIDPDDLEEMDLQ
ncbi:hypothetical protein Tco_0458493, partial [Tanacetum coccineum]